MGASGINRSVLLTVSQSRRRVLVVMLFVVMFAFSSAYAFGPESGWFSITSLVAGLLYTIVAFWFVHPINREVANRKRYDLDERQLELRNRAHYYAYQILGVFLVSLSILPMAAALYGGARFPMSFTVWQFGALFFLSANLVNSLPASVLAWIEPDPKPDE